MLGETELRRDAHAYGGVATWYGGAVIRDGSVEDISTYTYIHIPI